MSARVLKALITNKMRSIRLVVALLFSSLLLQTAVHATAVSDQPAVLFSIKPLAMIYKAMAVESMPAAQVLIDNKQNLHDYQLSVADLKRLQNASAFYWLGEEANLQKLSQRLPNGHWIELKDIPEHGWLHLSEYNRLIAQISENMQKQFPRHATHIQQRYLLLQRQIQQRVDYWQKQFKPHQETAALFGHSAFAVFASELGLKHAEIYRSGNSHGHKADGMQNLLGLQKHIALGNIRCAFAEPDISFHKLKGRYPQLQVVMLEPLGQSIDLSATAYIDYIDSAASSIYQCLKGGA